MIKISISEEQKKDIEETYWKWISQYHLKKFMTILKQDYEFRRLIVSEDKDLNDGELEKTLKKFLLLDCCELEQIKIKIDRMIKNGVKTISADTENFLLARYQNYRKSQAAKIIHILGINSCPYCNQNHINVGYDTRGKLRFYGDLDHFYDKSTYPQLAVCLYNMIPVCKICNQLKASQKSNIVNPFDRRNDSKIKFRTKFDNKNDLSYLQGNSYNFEIIIDKEQLSEYDKDEVKIFKLEERYKQLKRYAQEIILKVNAYDTKYQELLKEKFEINDKELEGYIFGYTEQHMDRVLSKFNFDIMNEFRD